MILNNVVAIDQHYLNVSPDQPVAALHDLLDIRVVGVGRTELAGAPLLLPVLEELGVAKYCLGFVVVAQGDGSDSVQTGLVI